jgi:hypothetical protein
VVILQAQVPQFLTRRYCGGRQAARGREDDLSPTILVRGGQSHTLAELGWAWLGLAGAGIGAPQTTWNTLTPRQKRGKKAHTRFVLSLPPEVVGRAAFT